MITAEDLAKEIALLSIDLDGTDVDGSKVRDEFRRVGMADDVAILGLSLNDNGEGSIGANFLMGVCIGLRLASETPFDV